MTPSGSSWWGGGDWTGVKRTELLWELYASCAAGRGTRRAPWRSEENMFPEEAPPIAGAVAGAAPSLGEIGLSERLRYEMEILHLAVSAHPITLLRHGGACAGAADSRLFENDLEPGAPIELVGVRDAARRVRTKRGETMLFLTLEDEYGLFECTLFPPVYRRFAESVRGGGPFRVSGRIEEHYGARTLNVETIDDLGGEEPLLAEQSGDPLFPSSFAGWERLE